MRRAFSLVTILLCGCTSAMQHETRNLNTVRVREALDGYEQARKSGDAMGMCVKAKLVAIAYEDAKDAPSGGAWRAREREDCVAVMAALGVSPPEPAK